MATEDSGTAADVVAAPAGLHKFILAPQPPNGPGATSYLPQTQQELYLRWKQVERPFAP